MSNYELLSPAGSPEILREVIAAGADAVYIGGDKFGARAFAKNFSEEDVLNALDHAHLRGKKIFLTVNTLLKNIEIEKELFDYILPFYKHGLDAIIVQDYGVFQFVRKYFPELPIHCSTQMSVSNSTGAQLLMDQGATRIVTARELSLSEIRAIYDQTHVEIESFVHGALCYCYSGQCLMSSLIGGRSGNRGRCAQPCRLPYQVINEKDQFLRQKEKYPLSPKDLCTIELLPDICEAGVYSFKIEGRMKQLEYAAGVTEVYRKYIDLYEDDPQNYHVTKKDYDRLLQLGNRNGFTKGYYVMHNGPDMITRTESSHSSEDRKEVYQRKEIKKIPIQVTGYFEPEIPGTITLISDEHPEIAVSVAGEPVMAAMKRPMSTEDIEKQLGKTGDTPFQITGMDIMTNGSCFIPNKQLNELRRAGIAELTDALLASFKRKEPANIPEFDKAKYIPDTDPEPFLHIVVSTDEQMELALGYEYVDMISIDYPADLRSALNRIHASGKKAGYFMPYVFRSKSGIPSLDSERMAVLQEFDRVWARSYDSLGYLIMQCGLEPDRIALDQGIYTFSDTSIAGFKEMLGDGLYHTIPYELNVKELRHLNTSHGDMVLYGHQPLMISAQCVYKNYDGCKKGQSSHGYFKIEDRIHNKFLINRRCEDCYNVIYNNRPLSLLHLMKEVTSLNCRSYRIQFTVENRAQMKQVMKYYKEAVVERAILPKDYLLYTTGHFHRGVD